MLRVKLLLTIFTLIALAALGFGAIHAEENGSQKKSYAKSAPGHPNFAPGLVVLELNKGADLMAAQHEVESLGYKVKRASKWSGTLVVQVQAGEELQFVDYFKNHFLFRRVLPDYLGVPDVTNYVPFSYPNDPAYSANASSSSGQNDWYLNQVGIDEAWNDPDPWMSNASKGRSSAVIAIVDTGINLVHEDVTSHLWRDPGSGNLGHNFVDASTSISDVSGHGTYVTGVASANTDNALGGAGFCVNCTVMVLRASSDETASDSVPFADAINYAVQNKVMAINLSWSFPPGTFQTYCADAWKAGSLVVSSMGNSGDNTQYSPAGDTNALGIGATEPAGNLSPYSSFGAWVGMCAPVGQIANGDGVFTDGVTCGSNPCGDPCTSCYVVADGTSFAAAQVSAMVAILADLGLSNDDIVNRLYKTAEHLGASYPNTLTGWGNLNAYRCLASCRPPSSLTAVVSSTGVSLAWNPPRTIAFATSEYIILRSTVPGGPYIQVGQTSNGNTTSFIDLSAMTGKSYYYVVKAVDSQQLQTLPSNDVLLIDDGPSYPFCPVLFPNPLKEASPSWIYLSGKSSGSIQVQIYTTAFRKVNEVSLSIGESGNYGPLEPKDWWNKPLANGLYYLLITGEGKHSLRKWLIIK